MFMNFRIDGITEDSLKICEISESASSSTTISSTTSTTTSTTTTSKAIQTTTSTTTTTTQQLTAISSTQPEISTLETQAPISTSQSIATNTESVPTLANTASRVVTETENISTTTTLLPTETATNAADISKSITVPQDEFISTEKSETTTTILDIINPRKIYANDKIVANNDEQLNDDLTTMSPRKENHEPNFVNDNTADTVEANDFVENNTDAIATTEGIIQEVRRFYLVYNRSPSACV